MNLLDSYILSWDTETTGVSPKDDRIVTASAVLLSPDGEVTEHWEWLINPGVEIPEGASAVHGISTEHAREHGENPMTSVFEIASVVSHYLRNKTPVVAYNASFDFSILNAECKRYLQYDFYDFFPDRKIPPYIIDPFVLDKRLDRYRKGSRTLTASAEVYEVELENAHASYDDCVAAVKVLRSMWDRYPVLGQGVFTDLYDAQIAWYKEQAEGLIEYFKKQGKDTESIGTVWPIYT